MPLLNSQYESIMRIYSARQAASRQRLEERTARIHADIPSLSALESDIVACQSKKVLLAVQGYDASQEMEACGDRLSRLLAEKDDLLSQHGYSPSDLEADYVCPDCRDTGYCHGQKCHCFRQAEIDLLYSQSDIRDLLKEENFDTFSYKWYSGDDLVSMRQTVAAAKNFVEKFDTVPGNMLLMGNVGTGKTFLSNCIAKELMDSCHSVVYLTAYRLFEELSPSARDAARENGGSADSHIFGCDLLIIDDLGTELANSFTVSQFFHCVNERLLRRRSTLISTNLDMEGLRSVYTERTFSRIISSYTIRKLPGVDIRLKKQLEKS